MHLDCIYKENRFCVLTPTDLNDLIDVTFVNMRGHTVFEYKLSEFEPGDFFWEIKEQPTVGGDGAEKGAWIRQDNMILSNTVGTFYVRLVSYTENCSSEWIKLESVVNLFEAGDSDEGVKPASEGNIGSDSKTENKPSDKSGNPNTGSAASLGMAALAAAGALMIVKQKKK